LRHTTHKRYATPSAASTPPTGAAKLVGDRIYLLLLIADPDGEETLKTFGAAEPASTD